MSVCVTVAIPAPKSPSCVRACERACVRACVRVWVWAARACAAYDDADAAAATDAYSFASAPVRAPSREMMYAGTLTSTAPERAGAVDV